MKQMSAEIQVRTVVMGSGTINVNNRSFWDRYSFLFSMDIASH